MWQFGNFGISAVSENDHGKFLLGQTRDAGAEPAGIAAVPDFFQTAILADNKVGFIAMFDSSARRLTPQQVSDVNAFSARIADPSDLLSCVIFDTPCARAKLKSDAFVSVKEFLQKHRNEMQVTFQEQPEGLVQAELHIPRRPDSATVPPPSGLYESLTLGFVKNGSNWKINVLFPEPYLIALQPR